MRNTFAALAMVACAAMAVPPAVASEWMASFYGASHTGTQYNGGAKFTLNHGKVKGKVTVIRRAPGGDITRIGPAKFKGKYEVRGKGVIRGSTSLGGAFVATRHKGKMTGQFRNHGALGSFTATKTGKRGK